MRGERQAQAGGDIRTPAPRPGACPLPAPRLSNRRRAACTRLVVPALLPRARKADGLIMIRLHPENEGGVGGRVGVGVGKLRRLHGRIHYSLDPHQRANHGDGRTSPKTASREIIDCRRTPTELFHGSMIQTVRASHHCLKAVHIANYAIQTLPQI